MNHLHGIYPKARWWIKSDGTDIKQGLRESMRNEWSGDIDWGNGELQKMHKEYLETLRFIRGIGGKNRRAAATMTSDLKALFRER